MANTGLTVSHWQEAQQEMAAPTSPPPPTYHWVAKFNFGALPESLTAAHWSPREFRKRNFPSAPLPERAVITIRPRGWDQLVKQLRNDSLITEGQLHHLNVVRSWLAEGLDPYVKSPGNSQTFGKHHLKDDEVEMALDSIATFILAGHIVGPFTLSELPYPPNEIKYIGLFGVSLKPK